MPFLWGNFGLELQMTRPLPHFYQTLLFLSSSGFSSSMRFSFLSFHIPKKEKLLSHFGSLPVPIIEFCQNPHFLTARFTYLNFHRCHHMMSLWDKKSPQEMMNTTSRRLILRIKKGLHERYLLLKRPTFSDLVGPVRFYRWGKFTGKILK